MQKSEAVARRQAEEDRTALAIAQVEHARQRHDLQEALAAARNEADERQLQEVGTHA